MGLDLWFRDDVQRILSSIAQTAGTVGDQADPEYLRGFHHALRAVAVGFGLSEPQISDVRTMLSDLHRREGRLEENRLT